jgi:LDH2 family malate/lactate/ureidoglycolate dehydrogenase
MKLTVEEARALGRGALMAIGYDAEDAATTTEHMIDAGLRGVTFGSLPRILALAEREAAMGGRRREIRVVRETPVSALIDGGDHVGYVVAERATGLAVAKAKQAGIAMVGANNTFYTGLFSYYMEMATREGLAAMAAGNGSAMVAPYGGAEARLSTNPIAFGFPAEGDPVIWDIGTAAIMQGEAMMYRRLGVALPEGAALDRAGEPTRDPAAALEGAIRTWGGHRGGGLSIVVQLLGMMCDAPAIADGLKEWGFLIVAYQPGLLMDAEAFKAKAAQFGAAIRATRPLAGMPPVRMPFDRSAEERRRRLQENAIEIPDAIHAALVELARRRRGKPGGSRP